MCFCCGVQPAPVIQVVPRGEGRDKGPAAPADWRATHGLLNVTKLNGNLGELRKNSLNVERPWESPLPDAFLRQSCADGQFVAPPMPEPQHPAPPFSRQSEPTGTYTALPISARGREAPSLSFGFDAQEPLPPDPGIQEPLERDLSLCSDLATAEAKELDFQNLRKSSAAYLLNSDKLPEHSRAGWASFGPTTEVPDLTALSLDEVGTEVASPVIRRGPLRVILVAVPGGPEADVQRAERWCSRCGIEDVTLVSGPNWSTELGVAVCSVGSSCEPGDTLVICGTGALGAAASTEALLPASDAEPVAIFRAAETCAQSSEASSFASLLSTSLPKSVTVLCVADDGNVLLDIQGEEGLRIAATGSERSVIAISLTSSAPPKPGLCLSSMLRAVEALSLADGPCNLTCQNVFNEMCDQAQDLAGTDISTAIDGLLVLSALPRERRPQHNPWPLAAVPRNWAHASVDSKRVRSITPSPAITPKAGKVLSVVALNAMSVKGQNECRPWSSSPSARQRRAQGKAQGGMPANLSGLSKMLTGGGALAAGRGPQCRDQVPRRAH